MEKVKGVAEIANKMGVKYSSIQIKKIQLNKVVDGHSVNMQREQLVARSAHLSQIKHRVPAKMSCFSLYTVSDARRLLGLNEYKTKALMKKCNVIPHCICKNLTYLTSQEVRTMAYRIGLVVDISKTEEVPGRLLLTSAVGKILECRQNLVLKMIYELYITRPTLIGNSFVFTEEDVLIIADTIESTDTLRNSQCRNKNKPAARAKIEVCDDLTLKIVKSEKERKPTVKISKCTASKISKLVAETGQSGEKICELAINNYLQMFTDLFC